MPEYFCLWSNQLLYTQLSYNTTFLPYLLPNKCNCVFHIRNHTRALLCKDTNLLPINVHNKCPQFCTQCVLILALTMILNRQKC